jgi:hypothetical protein
LYHNAAELARILAVSCPAHSICDLGEVMWVGKSLPLRRDDEQFCSCPPSPVRELLLGRRGPLDEAEHRAQEERWMREYGPSSDEQFRRDQERVKQLLRIYEFKKSLRGETKCLRSVVKQKTEKVSLAELRPESAASVISMRIQIPPRHSVGRADAKTATSLA